MSSFCPSFVVFGDEWGIHPTSTQHLVRRIAENHRLLYVNTLGLRPPKWTKYDVRRSYKKLRQWASRRQRVTASGENALVYSPFMLPFSSCRPIRRWNQRRLVSGVRQQMEDHEIQSPVLLVSSPIGAEVTSKVDENLLVYYITDHYPELPGVFRDYVTELEQKLLAESDLIFVTSVELQRTKLGSKVAPILLPHAVEYEHFHSAAEPRVHAPAELAELPRPIIGFYGLLAPWVDTELILRVATAYPQASVVLIGPQWGDLKVPTGPKNLVWMGPKSYAELPRYAAQFDVGIIPFCSNGLTSCVNPLKLLEYLAMGFPVVSTSLPDSEYCADVIFQSHTADEFIQQVGMGLDDTDPARKQRRFEIAASHSWEARATRLLSEIRSVMERRN